MANKLFELFEQWFGQSFNKNLSGKTSSNLSDASKNLDDISESMDELNDILIEQKETLKNVIKAHGSYSDEAKKVKNDIKQTERELKKENDDRINLLKKVSKQAGISNEDVEDFLQNVKMYGEQSAVASLNTNKFKTTMTQLSSSLGFDLKLLSSEFFTLGSVIVFATQQLIDANNQLVEFGRRSGGTLNYKQLGFTAYGSNVSGNVGSLAGITNMNNISESQFFEALQGFSGGNVLGQDYSKAAADLQKFGVQQARLIKLYGVAGSDIDKITRVSTQLYGVTIKQLNKEFDTGAKQAKMAGLNVQQYFSNLARLSDMIGDVYVRGGTEGLQKLAMFATKLNASVDSLIKFGEGFENIGDIYEKQAMATALGLRNFAANTSRMFAQYQLGLQEELSKTAISALAKDLQKYTDQQGMLDYRGIRAVRQLGLGQEQVQVIQRTIQAQKRLGVSFEELSDVSKMSAEKQFAYYAEMNRSATITEKLNKLWGQFKTVILDPIVSILGPALDITINTLIAAFQILYVVLKPIINGFQIIGKALSNISDKIASVTGFLEEKLKGIGMTGENVSKVFQSILDVGGTLIAALITFRAATYAASAAQKFGSSVGGLLGNLPIGGRAGAIGRLARMKGGKLLGGIGKVAPKLLRASGIGLAGGIVGDLISSGSEEGSVGDRLGGALSGAATGAAIGSIIPGVGTAIGAAVGGILGLFSFDEIKDGIMSVVDWTKGIFSNTKETKDLLKKSDDKEKQDENMRLAQQMMQSENVFKKVNDMLNSRVVDAFEAERAQEKIIQQRVAKPEIKVTTGLLGGAKVKVAGW